MMKTVLSSVLLVATSTAAIAQTDPAVAPAPATPTIVNVTTTAPAGDVKLQLSAEDQELIADGEIGTGAHIGGGLAAAFIGFGVGHAVQGRWGERGWIFTVGETASLGLMIYGMGKMASSCVSSDVDTQCESSGLGYVAGGAIAVSALHLWETIDAFVAPMGHNRRVRAAQMRAGLRVSSVTPYLTPVSRGDGAVGGLSLRF